MKKDFVTWHSRKAVLHETETRPFFNEREVWFCSLGANVGSEQDGSGELFLRPVVVLKKFNTEIFWGIPTTRSNKKGSFYFRFSFQKDDFTTAILSQIRLIDAKRLSHPIGMIRCREFAELKKRLISFLK